VSLTWRGISGRPSYEADAEGEGAAGAAMLKWAYTVCYCVKSAAAARANEARAYTRPLLSST
jgi:hypothetical protein